MLEDHDADERRGSRARAGRQACRVVGARARSDLARRPLDRTRTARIRVDLCEVDVVDAAGRYLLALMHESGAQLVASGCAMSELIREITGAGRSSAGAAVRAGPRSRSRKGKCVGFHAGATTLARPDSAAVGAHADDRRAALTGCGNRAAAAPAAPPSAAGGGGDGQRRGRAALPGVRGADLRARHGRSARARRRLHRAAQLPDRIGREGGTGALLLDRRRIRPRSRARAASSRRRPPISRRPRPTS